MSETATPDQVAAWLLELDDKWELMRVNWQQHDPFTQVGMWQVVDGVQVNGITMILDRPPCRGYVLEVDFNGVISYVAVATYYERCHECLHHAHDSMRYPFDDEDGDSPDQVVLGSWAVGCLLGMFEHAMAHGIDNMHAEGCSHYKPGFPFEVDALVDD